MGKLETIPMVCEDCQKIIGGIIEQKEQQSGILCLKCFNDSANNDAFKDV